MLRLVSGYVSDDAQKKCVLREFLTGNMEEVKASTLTQTKVA